MSAQQLADRTAELGMPIPRSVLANLESGRRDSISVAEVLVLAAALRVPPLLLLFPAGTKDKAEPLPGRVTSPWNAAVWFAADTPPGVTAGFPGDSDEKAAEPLRLYRDHQRCSLEWLRADMAARSGTEAAAGAAETRRAWEESLRLIRRALRDGGYLLPPLPAHALEGEPGRQWPLRLEDGN